MRIEFKQEVERSQKTKMKWSARLWWANPKGHSGRLQKRMSSVFCKRCGRNWTCNEQLPWQLPKKMSTEAWWLQVAAHPEWGGTSPKLQSKCTWARTVCFSSDWVYLSLSHGFTGSAPTAESYCFKDRNFFFHMSRLEAMPSESSFVTLVYPKKWSYCSYLFTCRKAVGLYSV